LQAAAAAPATDPAGAWPRIKIDGLSDSFDPLAHGGEPAFGRCENLVVEGQTLYADYVVPPGLAAVIDWSFPGRSVEAITGSMLGPTATGRTHELIVTAVALLGVDLPGVSTLPDLMDVLAEMGTEQPEQAVIMATIAAPESPAAPDNSRAIRAGLDQELVRRRFFDLADGGDEALDVPEGERGWDLWIRSLRFDDDGAPFLVVEAWESGRLYRYGFAVSGNDVSFTLSGEVVEQYVAASAAGRRNPVAVWATRDESRAVMANRGGAGMTPEQIAALAAGYGLDPASATEADVMAAATAAAEARENPPDPTPEPVAPEPVPEPVAASAEARTVTVTAAQHEAQQNELAALRARLDQRDAADQTVHRDGLVAAALADGRIAPSERDQWRADLNDAPEATERILARLTPNRIPVVARGVDRQEGVNAGGTDEDHAQYMRGYGRPKAKVEVNGVTMISGGV
jgi:hypothetical protein